MTSSLSPDQSILGLDVGEARIGVARAGALARLSEPLPVIARNEKSVEAIAAVVEHENVGLIVVGLPRNLKGEETAQSRLIRAFAKKLDEVGKPVVFADESMSSVRADAYLTQTKRVKHDQDSIAACYILQEFFNTIGHVS